MKKMLCMLLAISVILVAMSGCIPFKNPITEIIRKPDAEPTTESATQPTTQPAAIGDATADAYLNMAQKYVDRGEYDQAVDVLQNGYEETKDARIAQMLVEVLELQKNAQAETTAPVEKETQPAAPADLLSEAGIQRRINLFLSNFAEQFFRTYPTDNYRMLRFAYIYSKINNQDLISHDNTRGTYMKKGDVDAVLYQYFGKTVQPENDSMIFFAAGSSDSILYSDDVYIFQLGDGEYYGYVAIATDMTKNGNGTYSVAFNIYEIDYNIYYDGSISHYYGMSAEEAQKDYTLTLSKQGQAVVKDYTRANGVASYHLVEYQIY